MIDADGESRFARSELALIIAIAALRAIPRPSDSRMPHLVFGSAVIEPIATLTFYSRLTLIFSPKSGVHHPQAELLPHLNL
jgi:hypothetical protein